MFAFHELMERIRLGVNRIGFSLDSHFTLTATVLELVERIETKVDFLMTREQVSWDNYQANVGQLVAGYKAAIAENSALRTEIDGLGKSTQDRINKAVDSALAEDSDHDAARIDAANNALPIIENGAPVPPRPADSTPQTTESGAHDEIGPDGTPVTVGPDDSDDEGSDDPVNPSDGDADATTGDPAGSDPAVNSGDDSGQTAATGDHSSVNADQSTDSATGA